MEGRQASPQPPQTSTPNWKLVEGSASPPHHFSFLPVGGQLGFPRLVLDLARHPLAGAGKDPEDHTAWSLGQASSGRTQGRRQLHKTATLLGTDHTIWCWPWGQLGLVLHLLKCASTNQRKPIY